MEALDGAETLLGRADELLERAQAAARAAHLDALAAGCTTHREALRRQRSALARMLDDQIRPE